jgi:hypothetical protein
MLVQIRWQGRKMAVPLSQLKALNPDDSTDQAIGDWHYWVAQVYSLCLTHGSRKLTIMLRARIVIAFRHYWCMPCIVPGCRCRCA